MPMPTKLSKQKIIQLEHMAALLERNLSTNVVEASKAVSGSVRLFTDICMFFEDFTGGVGIGPWTQDDRVMMVLFYLEANR